MILGRPVLPPEVGAFQQGETTSGSGSSLIDGSGSKPGGSVAKPGCTPSSTPTSSFDRARSRIAWRSATGSLHDSGCGVAPTLSAAQNAT
ncbi:hypothetical protein [Actinomadura madurae]|uniref:hypothetical protein n=1 Tax=Actinomadura madurae TaxID=1993 RepID=UPI0020D202A9|nr:hypothetical protein [Actinomadura madurae]MCQ0015381.1 hypothetical protein [Actinomadura madurae]